MFTFTLMTFIRHFIESFFRTRWTHCHKLQEIFFKIKFINQTRDKGAKINTPVNVCVFSEEIAPEAAVEAPADACCC